MKKEKILKSILYIILHINHLRVKKTYTQTQMWLAVKWKTRYNWNIKRQLPKKNNEMKFDEHRVIIN